MLAISEYQTLDLIYESDNSVVYRGKRQTDGLPIILKMLKQDYPSPEVSNRYQQEYEITKSLDISGVIKVYDLQEYQNTLIIILEDFGGIALKKLNKIPLEDFLPLAIYIADSLGKIHANNIIHKDINPANIVWNQSTAQLKIIDFGIASRLPRENPILKNPEQLEGSLAYVSPEQTGRMNRSLDYRTDLYSLGITFYELLTGKLPFEADSAIEWVHCHIAKQPKPVHVVNPEIPLILSDLVMKLMAKNVEERYQSVFGMKWDLERCLSEFASTGKISAFTLGEKDFSNKLQIPQKLYGREKEIYTLLQAFERVSNGSGELLLIAGYSGVGKTALVNEVHKPMTEKRGYFASGKFDQYQRNIPYSALTTAFNAFCTYLLTESAERLKQWREKILKAVGNNGQVLIDVIPQLELVIGPQPAVAPIGPNEAQNRFNLFFQNFFRAICQKEHPLVLFIDDLQWADLASLNLLKTLLTDLDSRYFLIIGAYRDNEVDAAHPLMLFRRELHDLQKVQVDTITLPNLSTGDVNTLVAETLKNNSGEIQKLSNLIYAKTHGNAFFTHEFLKSLVEQSVLAFDMNTQKWHWELARINALNITDNVAELMANKINELSASTQTVLKLAACIGNQFDLHTLSLLYQQSPKATLAQLSEALTELLIFPLDNLNYDEIKQFKFQHDQIQQSAYSLLDEEQKKVLHLHIGRILLQTISTEKYDNALFNAVDHLNKGRTLLKTAQEQVDLATLNLRVGKEAKRATAYSVAKQYLEIAMACLPAKQGWHEHYALTLALHQERAEIESLNGDLAQSKYWIGQAIKSVRTTLEQGELYYLLVLQYVMSGEYATAIETGKKALSLLNVELPEQDYNTVLALELPQVDQNLAGRKIAALITEPEMIHPEKQIIVKILTNMLPACYATKPELLPIVAARIVNLSLTDGYIPEMSQGYGYYALIINAIQQDFKTAYEFAQLALALSKRFNHLGGQCKAATFLNLVMPWIKSLREADALNEQGYQAGLESGEFQFAGYILDHKLRNAFYQGQPLESIISQLPSFLKFCQRTQNHWAIYSIWATSLSVRNLCGLTATPLSFDSAEMSEATFLAECEATQGFSALCFHQILKSQILYLYGHRQTALHCTQEAEKLLSFIPGMIAIAEHNFYYSLILIACYPDAGEQQAVYWEKLEANQTQMKFWAENCPSNFLHKYLLVAAEKARLLNENWEANQLYDQAITLARKSGFTQNEALGNELAARFWLEKGKEEFASTYLRKAYHGYQHWGAKVKQSLLEVSYTPWLSTTQIPDFFASVETAMSSSSLSLKQSGTVTNVLDLNSIIKASQALSGEIFLNKLLEKLMHTVVENAGARRGLLILETQGNWAIEAQWTLDQEQVDVLQSLPLLGQVPSSIINYVTRTKKSVVLDKATEDSLYQDDDYVRQHRLKSVLCMPIISQQKLVGIVYLENNLAEHVFTPKRIEILSLLSSQIATSLENARFVRELESARHQAEIASQTKTALLANVSHELRTPLNGILGYIHLFNRRSDLTTTFREGIQLIQQNSEYLLTLINDIIDIANVETGKAALSAVDIRLDHFLNNIVTIFHNRAREKKLKFNTIFSPALPVGVFTDEKRLRQILTHLLSNAVKFTQRGEITLTVAPYGDKTRFLVEDTGVGIKPEDLERIFLPFEQVSDWKNKSEGAGLGLSLAVKLVEALGGELHVDSQVGQGSRFWVDLPLTESREWQQEKFESATLLAGIAQPNESESGSDSLILLEATLSLLSTEQIAILYDLSMNGDVKGLIQQAEVLEQLGPQFMLLVEKIRETTKVYDTDTIGDLLQPFVGK